MTRLRTMAVAALTAAAIAALPASALAATTASDSDTLTITAPVTASITMDRISDGVAAVSAFSFPETAPGATSADSTPYQVDLVSTSAKWQISAAVTTAFEDAGTGATLPNSAILVDGAAQGGTDVDLSTSRVLQTNIARGTLSSSPFTFAFAPSAGADSGTYSGVVTVTAATL